MCGLNGDIISWDVSIWRFFCGYLSLQVEKKNQTKVERSTIVDEFYLILRLKIIHNLQIRSIDINMLKHNLLKPENIHDILYIFWNLTARPN